jgi:hypothetical protein
VKTIKLITIVAIFLLASEGFAAGDGTWPLRLRGGDGTWPLRFNGESLSLQNPVANPLTTALTIASLNSDPIATDTPISFSCSASGEAHSATGSIKIGSTTFNILGICYREDTDSIEIISEFTYRQGQTVISAKTRMTGNVPENEEASDLFSGRIAVGENVAEEGRYKFDVNKIVQIRERN